MESGSKLNMPSYNDTSKFFCTRSEFRGIGVAVRTCKPYVNEVSADMAVSVVTEYYKIAREDHLTLLIWIRFTLDDMAMAYRFYRHDSGSWVPMGSSVFDGSPGTADNNAVRTAMFSLDSPFGRQFKELYCWRMDDCRVQPPLVSMQPLSK